MTQSTDSPQAIDYLEKAFEEHPDEHVRLGEVVARYMRDSPEYPSTFTIDGQHFGPTQGDNPVNQWRQAYLEAWEAVNTLADRGEVDIAYRDRVAYVIPDGEGLAQDHSPVQQPEERTPNTEDPTVHFLADRPTEEEEPIGQGPWDDVLMRDGEPWEESRE